MMPSIPRAQDQLSDTRKSAREKYAELGMEDRLVGVDGATAAQVQAARDIFTAAGLVAP